MPEPTVDPELAHHVNAKLAELCGPLSTHADVLAYITGRALRADAEACGCFGLPLPGDAQLSIIEALAREFGGRQALIDVGLMFVGDELRLHAPENRLCIPWRSADGRISVVQRRRIDRQDRKKYVFPLDASPAEPFGASLVTETRAMLGSDPPIIVTEGALDTLARRKIARLGSEAAIVVGVPSATMARPEWSAMFESRQVIVAFDPDGPGDRGAARFIEVCLASARRVERERSRFGDWNETLLHLLKRENA